MALYEKNYYGNSRDMDWKKEKKKQTPKNCSMKNERVS